MSQKGQLDLLDFWLGYCLRDRLPGECSGTDEFRQRDSPYANRVLHLVFVGACHSIRRPDTKMVEQKTPSQGNGSAGRMRRGVIRW